MEDIRSVLSQFQKKRGVKNLEKSGVGPSIAPTSSEIPDIFFDEVLHQFKLNRHEILILMHLYRQIWCRPNLYKKHGIGPLNSFSELGQRLALPHDELVHHLHNLENYGLIETVRSGQYFIRKFFTEVLDLKFAQNYDEFL
jgi:DNA-binding MarR family transcriptional regulator